MCARKEEREFIQRTMHFIRRSTVLWRFLVTKTGPIPPYRQWASCEPNKVCTFPTKRKGNELHHLGCTLPTVSVVCTMLFLEPCTVHVYLSRHSVSPKFFLAFPQNPNPSITAIFLSYCICFYPLDNNNKYSKSQNNHTYFSRRKMIGITHSIAHFTTWFLFCIFRSLALTLETGPNIFFIKKSWLVPYYRRYRCLSSLPSLQFRSTTVQYTLALLISFSMLAQSNMCAAVLRNTKYWQSSSSHTAVIPISQCFTWVMLLRVGATSRTSPRHLRCLAWRSRDRLPHTLAMAE